MPIQAHPLAVRIHDRVLSQLGAAMVKAEMCEKLDELGRYDDMRPTLAELRSALEETVVELRSIMAELRTLKNDAV